MSDESSANADDEIVNAVRPGLATTGGPLIIASKPLRENRRSLGNIQAAFRQRRRPANPCVAQGASREFNPSLPQAVVDRALARDHAKANAEYLAQFRNNIESFVPFEVVRACVGDYVEMGPLEGRTYSAFCDPSGGSSDSFTMAISHKEGERVIIDCIREFKPPFSPEAVIDELSATLRIYRTYRVTGDRYGGEFPRELFRRRNVSYIVSEKTKSDLFRDLLPLLNSGGITLPKSDRLVRSRFADLNARLRAAAKTASTTQAAFTTIWRIA